MTRLASPRDSITAGSKRKKPNGKAHSNGAASPRQHYAARLNAVIEKTVAGFIEAGRILLEAKEGPNKLPHGEFLKMVREDLCFGKRSPRMCQMLMRIARHPVLSNAKYISLLPPSWALLYDLATALSERELKQFIGQGLIHPGLKRRDLDVLQERLLTSNDGDLHYLFVRLAPLLPYPSKFPAVHEAIDRLWAMRDRCKWVDEFNPADDGHLADLRYLINWLKEFHDAWERKLPDWHRDDRDQTSPAFLDEKRRQQKRETEEAEERRLDRDDERALGLDYDSDDFAEAYAEVPDAE